MRLGWVTRNATGGGTTLSTCEVRGEFEIRMFDGASAVPARWVTVLSNSSSAAVFVPATDWVDGSSTVKVRAVFEVLGLSGDIEVTPAFQSTFDPTNPGSASTFGSTATSDGVEFPTAWETLTTADQNPMIRFGWSVILGNGSTLSYARVGGSFQRLAE